MPVLGKTARKAFTVTRLGAGAFPEFSGVNGQIAHDGWSTVSGMKVAEDSSLRVAACWIANTLIADEISSLVFKLVRRDDTSRKPEQPPELAPLWDRPNPDQVLNSWLATDSLSLTLWGASYNFLGWKKSGALGTMWPIDPSVVKLERIDEQGLRLTATGQGELNNRAGDRPEFMMIPLYTLPGRIEPISPVKYAAELLGLSSSYERTAARLMGRGLNPSAILTAGEQLPPEMAEKLSGQLSRHGGANNAGGVVVLGGKDLKLERLTMSMADAEFVKQRQDVFNVVMALWRVPPTVAGMVDKPSTWGTGVSAFAQGLERFTLRPIVQRLQAGFEAHITKWVDPGLQVRFKFDSLLSASPKERTEIQRLSLANGISSVQRVLAQNDEPPFDGAETVYSQLAMATEEDRALQRLKTQADAAAVLIGAGVPAEAAFATVGLQP